MRLDRDIHVHVHACMCMFHDLLDVHVLYTSISETELYMRIELVKSDLRDWTGLYDTSGHISSLCYILVEIWVVAFAVKNRQEVYRQHCSPENQHPCANYHYLITFISL